MVFNTLFNNILVISWRSVLLVEDFSYIVAVSLIGGRFQLYCGGQSYWWKISVISWWSVLLVEYFSYIGAVSLIGGVPGEHHPPTTSH